MYTVDSHFFDTESLALLWEELEVDRWLVHGGATRVAICLESPADLVAALLYIREQGASVLAIPAGSTVAASRRLAQKANCDIIIHNRELLDLDKSKNRGSLSEGSLIQLSSGTTGEAKVIERSWKSIEVEIESTVNDFTEPNGKTVIIACPVSHSYGFISAFLVGLKRGSKIEIVSNANPKGVLKALMRNKEHILYAAPVYLQILSQLIPAGMVFDSAMTSGVQMTSPQFDEVKEYFKSLYQQYGCSELGCVSICSELNSPEQVGSPLSHLQVVAGQSLETAAEITVTSHDSSVILTGDIGFFKDGVLHYLSRIGDMINVAGVNVYPSEVEGVMLAHPEVVDAVVYGVRDPVSHQKVHAVWVGKELFDDEYALQKWLAEQLTKHQLPAKLTRVSEIEKSPNGKVSRKLISETIG